MSIQSRRSPRGHLPEMYWWCTFAWLGFLVSGCASTGNHSDTTEKPAVEYGTTSPGTGADPARVAGGAAVGAVGGALYGGVYGLTCGPAAVICVPAMAVAGGVTGAVVGGLKAGGVGVPGGITIRAGGARSYGTAAEPPKTSHLVLAGPIEAHGPLPSGDLFVDSSSIVTGGSTGDTRNAYLVVNIAVDDLASARIGASSYSTSAEVDCSTLHFAISRITKYSSRNAAGLLVDEVDISPPLLIGDDVDKPAKTLKTAVDIVCKDAN